MFKSFPASIPQGPGIWKVKTSVLQSDDYVNLAALGNADGSICSDMDVHICIFTSLHSYLFSADTFSLAQDILLGNLEHSLNLEQASLCHGPLTVSECHTALFDMTH